MVNRIRNLAYRARNVVVPTIVSITLIVATILGLEIAGTKPPVKLQLPAATSVAAVSAPSLILSGVGITQTTTGQGVLLGDYTGDCYEALTVAGTQTVTLAIQHSPDNFSWFALYSFDAASASTTAFTHTALYGSYIRGVATVGTTTPVTVSLLCVFRP